MKIAFLIAYEQSPYAGVVRPFVNWAKALGNEAVVAVHCCSGVLENHIREIANKTGFSVLSCNDFQKLSAELKSSQMDYLFSDDYAPRLRLLVKARRAIGAKCVTYVQTFYGAHSLMRSFDRGLLDLKTRTSYYIVSALPFKLVSRTYRSLLSRVNMIIANSRFTAITLNLLYGIELVGFVYPPVDIDVFKPRKVEEEDSQILIYLGSNGGDTNPKLVQELVQKLNKNTTKIHLLGNEILYRKCLNQGGKLFYHKGLADEELAQIYSQAKFVMAPQAIEFFGFVPVESLSCGTPVLVRYPHEALCEEAVGRIAYNDEDFVASAKQLVFKHTNEGIRQRCREIASRFSLEHSKSDLLRILGTR